VSPFVTVAVNYPAPADAQITLTITGTDGIATIQSPVTVHAGESFANAAISVVGNPPNLSTVTLTINASIASAIGPVTGPTATFSVVGGAEPIQ
jgi:hypothetical protein